MLLAISPGPSLSSQFPHFARCGCGVWLFVTAFLTECSDLGASFPREAHSLRWTPIRSLEEKPSSISSEFPHVDMEHIGIIVAMVTPYALPYRIFRKNPSGIFMNSINNAYSLLDKSIAMPSRDVRVAGSMTSRHGQSRGRPSIRPAQQRSKPREQLLECEWLWQVVITASV